MLRTQSRFFQMPTSIFVISGFLGAGKTTLINRLLESAPRRLRIMVLVNEFGRVSIDKKMIAAAPASIVDLSGGCICCGLVVELIASIRFALEEFRADVILIESTGLALPQEIARQVLSPVFEGRVEPGGILTVVDAGSVLKADYPIIEAQLKEADYVVLNKIDLIDPETLEEVRSKVRRTAGPRCRQFETRYGRITYNDICAGRSESPPARHPETPPREFDSTAGFATVCLVRSSLVDADRLVGFYQKQRHKIVRSKGFVMTEKGGVEVQLSPSGIEVKPLPKPLRATELVLIVKEEDKEAVEREVKKVFD